MTDNTPNSKNNATGELPEVMLEEAAIWQARLRDANPGTAEERRVRADFSQWLLADTRHRQAFAEMESLWGALQTPVEQLLAEQQVAERSIAYEAETDTSFDVRASAASGRAEKHRSSRATFTLPMKSLATAACLVLAIFATVGWQQDWMTQWQSDYISAVGEQLPIQPDDGSRITLNTDSALDMDYSARERRVTLLKGEAWFNVASTDKRPFIVSTEAGAVRVTGTQFNVRLDGDTAIVSLDEGRVELRLPGTQEQGAQNKGAESSGTSDEQPFVLEPGQQAVLFGNRISAPEPFDRTAVTAWLRGQFVFYNTPLAEVVDTLNRYRHGRIVVTSRELNSLKVSGIFSTEDPDAALEVIASTLPIQQTRLTDYLVLIR